MFNFRRVVGPEPLLLVQGQVAAHPDSIQPGLSRPRRLTMMIDTGARGSAVLESHLVGLGPVVGSAPVRTVRDVHDLPIYRVWLSLVLFDPSGKETLVGRGLGAIAIPPRPTNSTVPYDGVVGMDVLALFRLHYDGPNREFTLACDG